MFTSTISNAILPPVSPAASFEYAVVVAYDEKPPKQSATVWVDHAPGGVWVGDSTSAAPVKPGATNWWSSHPFIVDGDGHALTVNLGGGTSTFVLHEISTTSKMTATSPTPTPGAITSSPEGPIPSTSQGDYNSQNSASPSATSSTIPTGNKGLSGGAAAGLAIGCLIAGALIAGLVAFFCLRRKKSTPGTRDSEASALALMHRDKGPVAQTVSVSSGSPITSALENGLPQPLEDKAISGEVSKISNLIKNHVQSYYHSRAISPGMLDYEDLQALGGNLPVSVGTLGTLLNNSTTRELALRFCLAWVVTSRIQLNDSPNTSFLPPEVAKCIQSMSQTEHRSRGRH